MSKVHLRRWSRMDVVASASVEIPGKINPVLAVISLRSSGHVSMTDGFLSSWSWSVKDEAEAYPSSLPHPK